MIPFSQFCRTLPRIRLGVWGKQRLPVGKESGAQLNERVIEALEAHVRRVREMAAELKAIHRYAVEESRALELDFLEGYANVAVRQVSEYDRPLIEDLMSNDGGASDSPQSLFPTERRWALVWEDVQENPETARRIREDPEGWVPVSYQQDVEQIGDCFVRDDAGAGGRRTPRDFLISHHRATYDRDPR